MTVLYFIDVVVIIGFVVSYFRNCYSKGYRLDFWYLFVFLNCIFVNCILYPFSKSSLNVIALGGLYEQAAQYSDQAFVICLFGYAGVLVGGRCWDLRLGIGVRRRVSGLLDLIPNQSLRLMNSEPTLLTQAMICLLLQALILSIYFKEAGIAFDLRSYTMVNPSLRPLARFAADYSVLIASHCLARFVDRREPVMLLSTASLGAGLLFFGARGNIAEIFLMVGICWIVSLRQRIGILRLGMVAFVGLFIIFYVGMLRVGEYSPALVFVRMPIEIFFGNAFSDLRDFALVLSFWNGSLFLGKTYLAAVFAFVPRYLSPFRDTWSLGVVTATMAGFDPTEHPGLRPGAFGEAYLNFGLVAVTLMGAFMGVLLRRVDQGVKTACTNGGIRMMRAFSYTLLIQVFSDVAVSSGFSSFYVMIGVFAVSGIIRGAFSLLAPPGKPAMRLAGNEKSLFSKSQ